MSDPTAAYIQDLRDIRSSGAAVKETSYYGALANLLNEVGKTLKPKVRCIINLANRGAGLPDGGLFTPDQFQRASEAQPLPGQLPSRGAIEIKGTGDDVHAIADSTQVGRYWQRYGQVLVTNYRDFILIGKDADGHQTRLEEYRLAPNERAFWQAARHPDKLAEEQSERFIEYLKRMMLHAAPLSAPQDVAWFLASYARDAKARIEAKARATGGELPALANVRTALEQSLGIRFEGEKGEHFFRSTLVQTLFYGVFSAWVLWCKKHGMTARANRFNWHESAWSLHVPMIRALFEQVATPSQLGPLDLVEVLDWTGAVLSRVDRAAFFERFQEWHAVQYFYEPFLEAFDPVLRKDLGVWYTPTEVVQYMVARVDTVLRDELSIADGLADPRVYVLDPCCGTGAFLVEVVRRIHETLAEGEGDALVGDDLKKAAMERVFGFEILPAPFVVAHLQLGLLLQTLGAPLADGRNERVGVYLTNALTGWEPTTEPKIKLLFPEMELEREAADKVKRDTPILVILGNPPYNGFAGLAVAEERQLSNAYRTTKRAPSPQGQGLNDLYVRFFRMADRRIVERSGQGIVCFISNYSWLDGLSYSGMRERYLEVFDRIWIDCLNGDKYRTGKLTPDGLPDPSVFSTEWNREGIQTGTAIALMVRHTKSHGTQTVDFRHFWGVTKRKALLESLVPAADSPDYEAEAPSLELGLPFTPTKASADYFAWPMVPQLFPAYYPGVQTKIDELVIDIDRNELVSRMTKYFDAAISNEEMKEICSHALKNSGQFDYKAIRAHLVRRGFLPEFITKHYYRPFDLRWIYWEPETNLLGRKSPDYFPQVSGSNLWFSAVQRNRKDFDPPVVTSVLSSLHVIECSANLFPLQVKQVGEKLLFDPAEQTEDDKWSYNLSPPATRYLKQLRASSSPELLFRHAVAVLHSAGYATEHLDSLRQDWPRIPLPASKALLVHSAEIGQQIAALFDTQAPVRGVAANPVRAELKILGLVSRAGGGSLSADDLAVTVGWGHPGKGGITMPGKGRIIEREYAFDETEAIGQGADALGLSIEDALQLLGSTTRDIYLNDIAYWKNVPTRVWEYSIGGYQVVKKWLSYRERDLLGRALTAAEAREVRDMVRRIAALILLQPELDANYAAVRANPYTWPAAD
jgi:Type ISP C-terminal specificity domain/N-6 DNA Methylase